MNKDKQIEEMAKQLYGNFGLSMPTARNVAKYLTEKKGYRKASEVAMEIFAEIEKCSEVSLMNGHIETPILCIGFGVLAKLKKKYEEGGV